MARGHRFHSPPRTCMLLDRECPVCGRSRSSSCHDRYLVACTRSKGPCNWSGSSTTVPTPTVPDTPRRRVPRSEPSIAPPQWAIGWDVFCWIGHRRFSRHWAVPQIQTELSDTYEIRLTDTAITQFTHPLPDHGRRSPARPRAPACNFTKASMRSSSPSTVCNPKRATRLLYVVRELTQKRVWFAEPLISATDDEVRRLIATAKTWVESLGKTVKLWISDKQEAFVKGIAAEFPDVPHRHCGNHFLRDLAKPVLEADSHAKVQMRKKVRGLRTIEKTVLKQQSASRPPRRRSGDDPGATAAGGPEASGCAGSRSPIPTSTVVLEHWRGSRHRQRRSRRAPSSARPANGRGAG